jgi:hypothetical protein
MPFDIDGAREYYDDKEIEGYLKSENPDFDFDGAKKAKYSLDEIVDYLNTKGGEQDNAKSQADENRNEGGVSDQQSEKRPQEGVQADEQRVQAYGQQPVREIDSGESQSSQPEVLLKKQETEGGEDTSEEPESYLERARKRKEEWERVRSEEAQRNQEEVDDTGGVQPSSQSYLERIIQGIKDDPEKAAIAGGEELAGTAIDLAVGGTVAGAISTLAEAGTLGAATPIVPALAMAGMAAGTWASQKVRQGLEELVGVGEDIKQAKEENPELAEAASVVGMLPQISKSIPRLLEMGVGEAAETVAMGAAGGAAFEAGVRYPVERGLEMATGAEEESQAPTTESVLKSAAFGALLAGHGAATKEGVQEIAEAGLPETAKVAGVLKTDEAIDQSASVFDEIQNRKNEAVDEINRLSRIDEEPTAEEAAAPEEKQLTQKEAIAQVEEEIQKRLASQEQPAEAEAEAQPQPTYAPEARKVEEDIEGKYPAGDQGREAAEAGRSDRLQPAAEGAGEVPKEEVTPSQQELEQKVSSKFAPGDQSWLEPAREATKPAEEEAPKPTPVAEPEGDRLGAAAYRVPSGEYEGEVFEGKSHLDAMEAAKEAGAITQEDIDAKRSPNSRNTNEFGYTTNVDGEFVTRDQAYDIAKESEQLKKDPYFSTKDAEGNITGAKLHSNETELDRFDEAGKEQIPSWEYAKDPKEAISQTVEVSKEEGVPVEETIKDEGLTRNDVVQSGAVPEEEIKPANVLESTKKFVREMVDGSPDSIPELTKVGAGDEAHQLGSVDIYSPVMVEDMISKVFPESYKNAEEMSKTADIVNKENIVGEYDKLKDKLVEKVEELKDARDNGENTRRLEEDIDNRRAELIDIAQTHDIEGYRKQIDSIKGTDIEQNIKRWEEFITPALDESYNIVKDVDPNTPREGRGYKYNARINLMGKSDEERIRSFGDLEKPLDFVPSASSYRNPDIARDKFMRKASLTGDYSTDVQAILLNSFVPRLREASKIQLYKKLESNGVAKMTDIGEKPIPELGGKKTERMSIKFPETNPQTGVTRLVEKNLYVQKQLVSELKGVLNVDARQEQLPIFKAFTKTQIYGFADASSHVKNLYNVTRNALGRDSAWSDIFAKIPIVGQAKVHSEIRSVVKEISENTPKIRQEKAELAKIGALRAPSKEEGFLRLTGMHQLIHDTDTASRILMNRYYDNLVKRYDAVDTVEARRNFINQVGNYNKRVMGRFESLFRDLGLSPFIVAGRAMNRYARRMVFLDPGFKSETMQGAFAARAANMSGLVFATVIPALTNMATTGSMWGRQGTPVGAIDFGPNFDTEDGKRRTFDIYALTGIRRGLRQLGISAAIDGLKNGKDIRDIYKEMLNDFVTTKLHPWVGPGIGTAIETLTGKRLDLRTGYAQRYEARQIEGPGQYVENFRIALKQLNPLLYGAAAGPAIEYGMQKLGNIPAPADELLQSKKEAPVSSAFGLSEGVARFEQALEKPIMGALGYSERNSPALQLANTFGESVQFTPEQEMRFVYRKKILDAVKGGDANTAKDLYYQGLNDGILSDADLSTVSRSLKYPERLSQKVQMLKGADQAVRVFKTATPEEQDVIMEQVANKIANSKTLKPEERHDLWNQMKKAAKAHTIMSSLYPVEK